MDHFADFDSLLRLYLGREKRLRLFGPPSLIERVEHKLASYTWNLVKNYTADLAFVVTELHPQGRGRRARFHCRDGFRREQETPLLLPKGTLLDEGMLAVRGALLEHGVPCVGFAVEEKMHVNVWKNRLTELNLPVGAWLKELKKAVIEGQPDETVITAQWRDDGNWRVRQIPLGVLKRDVLRIVPGQKVSYVVDTVYTQKNVVRVIDLIAGSDVLFIEAPFLEEESEVAARKCHLTARQAGLIGRAAGVKRLVPFHFSPRHSGREQLLIDEAQRAFGA
jgi:ribonuclease Z